MPVVVLSQLTRAPEREDRKPQLSDLRESGAIEQDADVVLFINRPNFYKTDIPEEERAKAELIIAKQRNGPTGSLNFVFLSRHTRFEEAAPDAWNAGRRGIRRERSASLGNHSCVASARTCVRGACDWNSRFTVTPNP